jgi:hypothetical protein
LGSGVRVGVRVGVWVGVRVGVGVRMIEGEPMTGAKIELPKSMPVQLYGPPRHAPVPQPGLPVHCGLRRPQ